MNYVDTLDYLYHRLPMFSRIGAAAIKVGLQNTETVCTYLNNPQLKIKTIHVAGTNGKGSVSHMLAAILQAAGYKTGLYTSPHLKDFRERIKVNGEMISKDFVTEFVAKTESLIEEINPSFFEITVGMAFDYFATEKVDIAVIETGLGGRLDSTNIIHPEISIITNIGWDHMQILGDSLTKIAFEKAGIIKENSPIVIGEFIPETKKVFEEVATAKKTSIHFASQKRTIADWHWEKHHLMVEVMDGSITNHKTFELDLPGIYQTKNLLTVLEACSQLKIKNWKIDDSHTHQGLKTVKKTTGLHGRWEVVHEHPTLVLDVAHNEDGIKQALQQLETIEHHQLHIIIGMVKDKDISKVLQLLPRQAKYYFSKAQIPRALPTADLAEMATTFHLKGSQYLNVNDAVKAALASAKKEDLILVFGSVFLVGEFLNPF